MTVPVYGDLSTFKAMMGVQTIDKDTLLSIALSAASRAIDKYTQRRFWLDPVALPRTFVPARGLLYLPLGTNNDIGDLTGFGIATDPSGKGTFSTVWAPGDWQLLPVNAPAASPNPEPWTAIKAVGTKTFPILYNTWLTRTDRIQVTARWGWPEIPDDVISACYLKAARIYIRKDSPQGVAGVSEFGPVRISRGEDSDVLLLLNPYRDEPVLVA